MPVTIHVNGKSNSLVHKGSMGVAKCTVPDVCKTPSPGGPVPVPYPVIVSMSSDLAKGTKTVKVDGSNPAAVKGSEFSRCTGDEPGTAGGVKSSTNMKEATWLLYSFDVKMDGKNACRLSDKMMMNHGNTVCLAGEGQVTVDGTEVTIGKCPCCGGDQHMQGEPISMEEWYEENQGGSQNKINEVKALIEQCSDTERRKAGCSCYKRKPKTRLLPTPPCNVFYRPTNKSTYTEDKAKITEDYDAAASELRVKLGVTPRSEIMGPNQSSPRSAKQAERWQATQQLNHLVPKSAGGCPAGTGNIEANERLCNVCRSKDKQFSDYQ